VKQETNYRKQIYVLVDKFDVVPIDSRKRFTLHPFFSIESRNIAIGGINSNIEKLNWKNANYFGLP